MMTVFDRIENLRKSKGLSQGKLEKELGFSNGSISKWKISMPNSERLQKLADYFGVTVDYLINGKESETEYYTNKYAKELAQFIFENPKYKVLFDASKKVREEDISFIKEFIDKFSNK